MSTVKQCDRCKVLLKEDLGVKMMKSFYVSLKIGRTSSFDLCDDCIVDFKKFLNKEK